MAFPTFPSHWQRFSTVIFIHSLTSFYLTTSGVSLSHQKSPCFFFNYILFLILSYLIIFSFSLNSLIIYLDIFMCYYEYVFISCTTLDFTLDSCPICVFCVSYYCFKIHNYNKTHFKNIYLSFLMFLWQLDRTLSTWMKRSGRNMGNPPLDVAKSSQFF